MSGGGGGQSGITRYDWNDTMAQYYQGNAGDPGGWLMRASNEATKPYQGYSGQRVYGIDPYQDAAMQGIYDIALRGGAPDTMAGRGAAQDFASGSINNSYGGMNNPYFNQVMQSGLSDITDAYRQGTAADTTRMFNLAGAFGGSAHQQAVQNNENALAKQLGNYTSQMLNDQYNRSADIEGQDINRQLQAIPLAFQGQGLGLGAAQALMGAGDVRRNYGQQLLDDQYQRWAEQQNYGRNAIDWMFNTLGRAQGSTGVSTQTPAYGGVNPMAGLLGAAALYGGMGGFG